MIILPSEQKPESKVDINLTKSSSSDHHDPLLSDANRFVGNLEDDDLFALHSPGIQDLTSMSQVREEDKISMFIASLDAI